MQMKLFFHMCNGRSEKITKLFVKGEIKFIKGNMKVKQVQCPNFIQDRFILIFCL